MTSIYNFWSLNLPIPPTMSTIVGGGTAPSLWNVVTNSNHSSSHLSCNLSKSRSDSTPSLTINTSEISSPMQEEPKSNQPHPPTPKMANEQNLNPKNSSKRQSSTYISQTTEISQYEIQLPVMAQCIHYMQDHALICKFMELWSSKKALLWWMKLDGSPKEMWIWNWDPKDSLRPFSIWPKIEKGYSRMAPIFFNSMGLYLRIWKKNFRPENEDFTVASVWIRLYSLPQEH